MCNLENMRQNEATVISECLDDIVIGTTECNNVALPGFSDTVECLLCQIVITQEESSRQIIPGGATLLDVFRQAEKEFNTASGKPPLNIATEVHQALQYFIERIEDGDELRFMSDITPQNIVDHFLFDHAGRNPPRTKEKVERVLLSMLSVGVKSCCQNMDNGQMRLAKDEAHLVLSIIDRLLKMSNK